MYYKRYACLGIIICVLFFLCFVFGADSDKERPIEFQKGEVEQIGYKTYGIKSLHDKAITGKGIKIAVLDTGIDIKNNDIKYSKAVNFTTNDRNDIIDKNGHGTKIAGIIGAQKNDIGMIGIAPESNLYICKIANVHGTTNNEILVEGIEWCIENDVDIINLSLEFEKSYNDVTEVINRATEKGIFVIASAGNKRTEVKDDSVKFPASLNNVISVSMLNKKGEIFSQAIKGKEIDIYAPGEDVVASTFNNKLLVATDNSSAVAYTSGVTALKLQEKGKVDKDSMMTLLKFLFLR